MPPMKNSSEDLCADSIGNCIDYPRNLGAIACANCIAKAMTTALCCCHLQRVIVAASWLGCTDRIQIRKPIRSSIDATHDVVQRKADQNPYHSQ
jgi:hypothetical protein